MGKSNIDLGRLELLIRGAEPEDMAETAFVICYVGTIVNDSLIEIAKNLREKLDIDDLTPVDWKYLFLGLVMGDKDFRDTIQNKNNETVH